MAGNTAQVYDQQGNVYQAVQLTQPTVINGMNTPAGWWSVTDQYGNTSAVRPDAFNDMFSPAQGIYLLGQAGGAASLNNNGLVVQHSQYEGQAGGVATLKNDGTLQQTSGLLLASSLGQPNGPASLNGSGNLAQTGGIVLSASLGVPNGPASLDTNGRVVQALAKGPRQHFHQSVNIDSYYSITTAWAQFDTTSFPAFNVTFGANASVKAWLMGSIGLNGSTTAFQWRVNIGNTYYAYLNGLIFYRAEDTPYSGYAEVNVPAGTYSCVLECTARAASGLQLLAGRFRDSEHLDFILQEWGY